jgi:hypothetical protein
MERPGLLRGCAEAKAEDAFAEVVVRQRPMIYAACLRVLGPRHGAEDAQTAPMLFSHKAASIKFSGEV